LDKGRNADSVLLPAMPLDKENVSAKEIHEVSCIRIDTLIPFLSDSHTQIGEFVSDNWNFNRLNRSGNCYSNNGRQRIKNTKDWLWIIFWFNYLADTHDSFYDLVEL
jgi:hypothetical protein